jgi:hypothetical protein
MGNRHFGGLISQQIEDESNFYRVSGIVSAETEEIEKPFYNVGQVWLKFYF